MLHGGSQPLDSLMHFAPVHGDLGRTADAELRPTSSNLQDGYFDLFADPNTLSDFAAQYQHLFTLPNKNFPVVCPGVCHDVPRIFCQLYLA
jgi:hypothetical protein